MSSQTPTRTSLPGSCPAGARDEVEAARQVREMFSRIAPRYDFLNHLLSLQLDKLWRRRVAWRFGHILARTDARVLDLCCGTGDLTLALSKIGRARVCGTDFAHPMLLRACQKAANAPGLPSLPSSGLGDSLRGVVFLEADSLESPFADASFDLVTAAFGFRNLASYDRGLREMYRLLRSGGEVGILEFSEPRGTLFGSAYRFYFTQVLPRLGGAISGNAAAYSYLPSSVAKFPTPEELAELMVGVGFSGVRFERWTGGVVALHAGCR